MLIPCLATRELRSRSIVESNGLSRELRFIESLREGSGRQVGQTRPLALPVITGCHDLNEESDLLEAA